MQPRTIGTLVLVGWVLLATVAVCLMTGYLTATVLASVASLIVFAAAYVGRKQSAPSPTQATAPPSAEEQAVTKYRNALQGALQLNLDVRNDDGVAATIRAEVEAIIDQARHLLPRLYREWPTSELTWEVTRVIDDYLPKLIAPYFTLSPAQRAAREGELNDGLRRLRENLAETGVTIESRDVNRFAASASFLRSRFAQESVR